MWKLASDNNDNSNNNNNNELWEGQIARVCVDRMQIACEDDVGRGEQHRYGATHAVVGQLRKWRTVGAR